MPPKATASAAPTIQTPGQNIQVECKDGKMVITIDTTKTFGLSKSEKTIRVASTLGNQKIQTEKGDILILGLNLYGYPEA